MNTLSKISNPNKELFGYTIRQAKDGMLNLSDLQEAYTIARVKNGWAEKNITKILESLSFRSWFEREFGIHTKEMSAKYLKTIGVYKTTGARETKTVWINDKIFDFLYDKLFEQRPLVPEFSFSNRYIKLLNTVFDGIIPFTLEYKVLNYRVDVYFESLNLCVEFDEPHHKLKSNTEKDKNREKQITDFLKCNFLRFEIGQEIESIREILMIYKVKNIMSITDMILDKKN